jgi:hypothetical protein
VCSSPARFAYADRCPGQRTAQIAVSEYHYTPVWLDDRHAMPLRDFKIASDIDAARGTDGIASLCA